LLPVIIKKLIITEAKNHRLSLPMSMDTMPLKPTRCVSVPNRYYGLI